MTRVDTLAYRPQFVARTAGCVTELWSGAA
jgi:hypothetical protein